jgi:hypothetical protein
VAAIFLFEGRHEGTMDISRLTAEEIYRLAPEQLQFTLEQRRLFTPEQRAAVLEVLDPAFRLPPDEQERREVAWQLANATSWREIAESCIPSVVESYRLAELDPLQVISAMHRATIGCWTQHRVSLLGLTVAMILRIKPVKRARGQRSPPWPFWLQHATAALVLEGQRRSPGRRTPKPPSDPDEVSEPGAGTSAPIAWALEILTTIGWFGKARVPKPKTVNGWVSARLQESPPPAAPES